MTHDWFMMEKAESTLLSGVCIYVCVCVRERETDRQTLGGTRVMAM